MTRSQRRVLFLSHSASRNGATILLLRFLRWLRPRVDWEIEVLVCGRGPLLGEFRSVAPTRVVRSFPAFVSALPQQYRARTSRSVVAAYCAALLGTRRFDLIYANTSAVWPLVSALRNRAPVLWHIHELRYALRLTLGDQHDRALQSLPERLIAVSRSVKESLVRDFRVPITKIDVVHGFVPSMEMAPAEWQRRRQRVRLALGWPDDAFVVGGCGSLGWRKGSDLFLQIARRMIDTERHANIRFLWVGGDEAAGETLEFDHDLDRLDLEGRCRRVPTAADVVDYYCAMDLFALTSREDPFPLVMLEAGALGVPTVCFAESGGGPEFVADGAGATVPYADVHRFAAELEALRDDAERRKRMAEVAAESVRAHHVVDVQGPQILANIQRCLDESSRGVSVGANAVGRRV
ncbi:MAG: glycosyltransferase family 4 protein [Aromatoleum sp.]|uniref:glycosyltransferase family 4 protein n=1 Tax=Aromatoleum sp. TaxID=2307007 RepID=UPI002895EA20|nr:glycosyltransferase family 4 protein [Aromatoleum sp.]MDT3669328.1 glycosyltransferase family 4 protein [Aromatoleum sp.]